ncbi:amino acid adenylation domain-containing protein [Streptomyces sp. NPDC049813]|uniref:amino acid adenylation domain-containing protein n=1 Tax=Streptomyces sp. NPDC049813 TaxID=3365597 RepID=UPI0037AA89FF
MTTSTGTTPLPEAVEAAPLSFSQRRLWFLERAAPGPAYNIPVVVSLRGELSHDALRAALTDVVARHEVLRTAYPDEGGVPCQRIMPPAAVPLPVVSVDDPGAALATAARHVFDLTQAPPVRATLFHVRGTDEHVLLVLVHHIAGDGWSVEPLLRDLSTAYSARLAGRAPRYAELPVQYADYTYWQQDLLGDPEDPDSLVSRQLNYWREALAGSPEECGFPADRPRPVRSDQHGASVPASLTEDEHHALLDLATRTGTTLFMVVHAAVVALLTRMGAGTDLPVGTVVAGRDDEALEDLVGFFVNTLVLRADASGDPSFAELLDRVRAVDLDAYAHQDVPFERVVEAVNPARAANRHPLFQVMLVLTTRTGEPPAWPGLVTELRQQDNGRAKFDTTIGVQESRSAAGDPLGLALSWEYATARYDAATAELLCGRLARLLRQVAADPGRRLSRLVAPDSREGAALSPGTADRDVRAACLHELIAEQCARTPTATALVHDGRRTTYAALEDHANRVARHLVSGPGDVVAVHLDRGPDLVAALLGVLKTGACYTLLDTAFPAERLRTVLDRTGIRTVVGTAASAEVLDRPCVDLAAVPATPVPPPRTAVRPEDPAVVMFTSGSTGAPKGVVSSHAAISTTLTGQDYAPFGPGERWLQSAPVSWDAFGTQVFGPLLHGGTCVLYPGTHIDPAVVAALVVEHEVTVFDASASLFNHVLDECPVVFATVRCAMTGGEPASTAHAAHALRAFPAVRLVNGYGPVESTGFSTAHVVTAADGPRIPIGRPLPGKAAHVLDACLRPVPPGGTGELYLTGSGLALGYLGAAAATAERFVADPSGPPGTRMYRTGDVVRWRPDHTLDYLGRADAQVKVRGFRVEPGEIEAALATHPQVARCAVTVREDRPGDKRLVAYAACGAGTVPEPAELRAHLAARLPDHLVPAVVVTLDSLPYTANGKLDRGALPAPAYRQDHGSAPRGPHEAALCRLFGEVLGTAGPVGADAGFFDLGGHSLLAIRLMSRIEAHFGTRIGVQTLFEAPTPAALATRLSEPPADRTPTVLLPLRTDGARPPLFCVHPAAGISSVYAGLLPHLPDRPVYGLQARALFAADQTPATIEEMARDYLAEVRTVQPAGPYHLLGWSFGAGVAHAMAAALREGGEEVALLAMMDGYPPRATGETYSADDPSVQAALRESLGHAPSAAGEFEELLGAPARLAEAFAAHVTLSCAGTPPRHPGHVLFFQAALGRTDTTPEPGQWLPYVGGMDVHPVACRHGDMTRPGPIAEIAAVLDRSLEEVGDQR